MVARWARNAGSPSGGAPRPRRAWRARRPRRRGRPVRPAVWWRGRTGGGIRGGWRCGWDPSRRPGSAARSSAVSPLAGGRHFVGVGREPGELAGAPGDGRAGEVGFLVPAEDRGGAGDQGALAGEVQREAVGVHSGGGSLVSGCLSILKHPGPCGVGLARFGTKFLLTNAVFASVYWDRRCPSTRAIRKPRPGCAGSGCVRAWPVS